MLVDVVISDDAAALQNDREYQEVLLVEEIKNEKRAFRHNISLLRLGNMPQLNLYVLLLIIS